jgi:Bacterial Ig domain
MKTSVRSFLLAALLGATLRPTDSLAQAGDGGSAPSISITWPTSGAFFTTTELIKIEASVTPGDSPIASVQFLADTNVIATVTNPPFAVVWSVAEGPGLFDRGIWLLSAVAVDTSGRRGESAPVRILYDGTWPGVTILRILSPQDGAVFAAPATFTFSAELVASRDSAAFPVQFFVGTNSVGVVTQAVDRFTADAPPYSMTVTNLPEGVYAFNVAYLGPIGASVQQAGSIRVTKLGIQSPSLTPDGRVQFGVVTSFPGKATVIEASPNLTEWSPIATNVPLGNTFTFGDPSPATNGTRFYRAVIPSQ